MIIQDTTASNKLYWHAVVQSRLQSISIVVAAPIFYDYLGVNASNDLLHGTGIQCLEAGRSYLRFLGEIGGRTKDVFMNQILYKWIIKHR